METEFLFCLVMGGKLGGKYTLVSFKVAGKLYRVALSGFCRKKDNDNFLSVK